MPWPFSRNKRDKAYKTDTLIADLQEVVLKLQRNWDDLKEHRTKHHEDAPVDLLNEIDDYRKALELTEQTLAVIAKLRQEIGHLNIDPDLKARLISIVGEKQ